MTTSNNALGRWPNAPLSLVVAQVRFVPNPDAAPNVVAERLRNAAGMNYPHISPLVPVSVIIGPVPSAAMTPSMTPSMTPTGFALRNPQNTEVIQVQLESVTFLSSAYQDSTQFINQWRTFMGAVCEDRELQVVRLGLRYVDFIVPSEGNAPEDYFLGGLGKSPDVLGEQSPVAFNLYDYQRPDGGQLRVQYARGLGPPMLPPDLRDSLPPPARFSRRSTSGPSAVLDMDRWRLLNQPLAADGIADEINRLRGDIRQAFRAIMSPLAKREWIQETEGE